MNPLYPQVMQRAARRCEYCRAPEIAFNFAFEVDHIVPSALGGTNQENNLALACHACNLYKSAYISGFDELTQSATRIFQPRLDTWAEHFWVNLNNRRIEGLTDVGRATVLRLRFNSPIQLEARILWLACDIFP